MATHHDDPVIDRINEELIPIQVENLTKDLSVLLRSMNKNQLEEYLPKILKGVCEPVSEFL